LGGGAPDSREELHGRTFVDTNVLIYAHDVDAKSKHATAKNILRDISDHSFCLDLQTL
jgi:predicted nucleic acid-binding protein